jgi:hypothetical protein
MTQQLKKQNDTFSLNNNNFQFKIIKKKTSQVN